ncbi:MAG TPA: type 1 glutamine amidotransferase domain-containing protein [Ferruginibacter sp.]|nr:type 1 glutamine amidotransferase domain-containing protein [Ferruginibacter sp.]
MQVATNKLKDKKIAIITENGFEEVELTSPKKALEDAGAIVHIISLQTGKVRAWNHDNWSIELPVDVNLIKANSDDYDALMIPGGVMNPDHMRLHSEYITFAQEFLEAGKIVAAICHAPLLLIETLMISGKEMTSYPSIKTDLLNAGVRWVDKEVVVDDEIITSRGPKDLPAFNAKLIEEIGEGDHRTRPSFVHHN